MNTTQHPCIECGLEPAMDDSAWCQGCYCARELRLTELNQRRRGPAPVRTRGASGWRGTSKHQRKGAPNEQSKA